MLQSHASDPLRTGPGPRFGRPRVPQHVPREHLRHRRAKGHSRGGYRPAATPNPPPAWEAIRGEDIVQRLERKLPGLVESRFAGVNLRPSAWEVRQRPHAAREGLRVVSEVRDRSYFLQA